MVLERLTRGAEAEVEALLHADPVTNLFLLSVLDGDGFDRGIWYGARSGSDLAAVVLVFHGRLAVPWAPDPAHATLIGRHLQSYHPPCMIVGPRIACDALWRAWAPQISPDRFYDQRLYVCRSPSDKPGLDGFRPATLADAGKVAEASGLMEEEDLGRNPAHVEPETHLQVIRDRIRAGRTWIAERDGEIAFQINVGSAIPAACQIGGTWVPPRLRGKGLAAAGMRSICAVLLRKHEVVTLHVNEANLPAVRTYERAGFERDVAFRLIMVKDP